MGGKPRAESGIDVTEPMRTEKRRDTYLELFGALAKADPWPFWNINRYRALEAMGEFLCCLDTLADEGHWSHIAYLPMRRKTGAPSDSFDIEHFEEEDDDPPWVYDTDVFCSPAGDWADSARKWVGEVLSGESVCDSIGHPHEGMPDEPWVERKPANGR